MRGDPKEVEMRTLLLLAGVTGLLLALPAVAGAKGLQGAELCGADGCATERNAALPEGRGGPFSGAGEVVAPSAPAPWLRGSLLLGEGGKIFGRIAFFYVPSADLVVQAGDEHTQPAWWHPQGAFGALVRRLAERVRPLPPPTLTSVTVDGRAVDDPQSYLRLYTTGKKPETYPRDTRSVTIAFHSQRPTPWSTRNYVVLYPSANILVRDGVMVAVSPSVTKAVTARASLDTSGGPPWLTIALALGGAAAVVAVALSRRSRLRPTAAPVPQA
jgi:hypothetical protein